MTPEIWISLGLSALAIFVWAVLIGRQVAAIHHGLERRASVMMMFFTGLLASVGTFSSALGSAQVNGLLGSIVIPHEIIIFAAAIGRGALLAGGLALLALWPVRPTRKEGEEG